MFSFIILILFAVFCTACSSEVQNSTRGDIVKLDYAKNFTIHKIRNGYVLSVYNSGIKSNEYLLSNDTLKKHNGVNIVNIPVESVVCLSSSHVAFIDILNRNNSIKAISGTQYIYNSDIQKKIQNNNIIEAGYENRIDYEKILSMNPDVIFAYSVDNNYTAALNRFQELNIPVVYINEFIEPTVCGRTEWLKFFACFYDELELAKAYCDSVFSIYNKLTEKVINNVEEKPIVISSMPWKGVWWSPGGASYFAKLIKDAGGQYIFENDKRNESIPLSIEEVFSSAAHAEIWLNPNNYSNRNEMLGADQRISSFKPYNDARIYNNNRKVNQHGGNDFWESGVVQPDLILSDLIKIFHPNLNKNHKFVYYKRIK